MISEIVERVARRAIVDRDQRRPDPHWGDFVLIEGLLDVYEASGDASYLDAVRWMVDEYVERGPGWGRVAWQWAGMGLPAIRLGNITGSQRYSEFGLAVAARLRNETDRTSDGGITPQFGPPQLWIDLLHFACPTFSEAALLTDDASYFDAATEQFRIFNEHLLDEPTGLHYHVWYEESGKPTEELWARGMAWLTVAAVEMLARLPEAHPDRQYIVDVLKRQLDAIYGLQDASGLWHTVIDRPDSYLETSTAAIFGMPVLRGIRLGVLDRTHLGGAVQGWRALQDKVSHDGFVFDVSTGTPPGDFDNYQGIALGVETYGTGLFLQLGVEMSRL